jgi:signal transduction histidine kinase
VRAAFVILTVSGGLGVLLYAVCWLVMGSAAREGAEEHVAEGTGPGGLGDANRILGIALVTVGLALLVEATSLGFGERVARPIGLVGLGLLVAWHRVRLGSLGEGNTSRLVRVGVGLFLAAAGIVGLIALNLNLAEARDTLFLSAAVVAGLGLVAAPTIRSLLDDLSEERRQRIRSEERARVAAHLHDSLLQTLALIQRHADDPAQMRSLARRQERELRAWLYGSDADRVGGTLRVELERIASEVEQLHGVPVELVVVAGDVAVDARLADLLGAARESMVNAAKHAGAPRIDVFTEVSDGVLELYVRDVGRGFDPAAVPPDRRGLRDSVRARMERVGGTATISSSPGEGTEVELRLPLEGASS